MKITKDQKQAEIVNTWNENNRIGLLTAVGSFGKSISAIKCALFIKEEKPIIHIIVPRQILKEQWEGILSTWKVENAEVFVVNSYIKTEMVCDFLNTCGNCKMNSIVNE